MGPGRGWGQIAVRPVNLSAFPQVCLCLCPLTLHVTCNYACSFWFVQSTVFILSIHIPWWSDGFDIEHLVTLTLIRRGGEGGVVFHNTHIFLSSLIILFCFFILFLLFSALFIFFMKLLRTSLGWCLTWQQFLTPLGHMHPDLKGKTVHTHQCNIYHIWNILN